MGLTFLTLDPPKEYMSNLEKYATFEIAKGTFSYIEVEGDKRQIQRNFTLLEYDKCEQGRFNNENDTFNSIGLGNNGWVCIKNVNQTLLGQDQSDNREYLRVRIYACVNETTSYWNAKENVTCAQPDEIKEFFSLAIVQIATLNQYFDQQSYSDYPIKNEISTNLYNIDQYMSSAHYLHVNKKTIQTRDSWLSSFFNIPKLSDNGMEIDQKLKESKDLRKTIIQNIIERSGCNVKFTYLRFLACVGCIKKNKNEKRFLIYKQSKEALEKQFDIMKLLKFKRKLKLLYDLRKQGFEAIDEMRQSHQQKYSKRFPLDSQNKT
eukprot:403346229